MVLLAVFAAVAVGVGTAVLPPKALVVGVGGVAAGAAGVYWAARVLVSRELLLLSITVASLILLRLPILANTVVVHVAVLIPFVVGIVLALSPMRKLDRPTTIVLLAFIGVLLIEVMRGALAGAHQSIAGASMSVLTYAVIAAFGFSLFVSAATHDELRRRFIALALAPSAYAVANIVLLAANITPEGFEEGSVALNTPADLLGLLGFQLDRINFPLGLSVNNYGVICGVGLASALVLAARHRGALRYWAVGGAMACTYCLLRGDSRASLLFALFFAVLIIQLPKLNVSGFAVLAPLAPIVLVGVFGALANTGFGEEASHQGRDISTGSGRTEIWEGVWLHVQQGNLQDFVGYGSAGQITSGAAKNYAHVFAGLEDPERFPVHNAFLQQLLDGGYIGVLILAALFFVTIRGLRTLAVGPVGTPAAAVSAGVLTLLFSGFTEVTPSYYAEETLMFLLLAAWGASTARKEQPAPEPEVISKGRQPTDRLAVRA